jgi:hypothetical protein
MILVIFMGFLQVCVAIQPLITAAGEKVHYFAAGSSFAGPMCRAT